MSSEPGKTSSASSEQAESARHGRGRGEVVDVDDSGLEAKASEQVRLKDSRFRSRRRPKRRTHVTLHGDYITIGSRAIAFDEVR